MSHSMTVQGWNLIFSGDYSGNVTIISPGDGKESDVPFAVLAELVGTALRDQEGARLESMTGLEYLASIGTVP